MAALPGALGNAVTADLPPSIRGWQPLVRPKKKVILTMAPFVEPGFEKKGAQLCWYRILNFRTPMPIDGDLVLKCTAEGIMAFAGWADPQHPWQILNQKLPESALLFDVEPFMPDVHISIRGSKEARTVKLWRQTHGNAFEKSESPDVGMALWERGHWVPNAVVEAAIAALARIHGENSALVKAVRRAWAIYYRDRSRRADNLRNRFMQFWQWCVVNEVGVREVPAEYMFEPTMLAYTFEVLPWVPTTADWCKEVDAVDAAQPWRNCWVDAPSEHPYKTTFVPCNPDSKLFVPEGMTEAEVGRAVAVNPELADTDISPQWTTMVGAWH
ncbi:hypothetical protein PR003_g32770 [Phytophthora rubi]|uniref:Uncharacterized protein n=1 Tax=Phytophthora rubi TaxID=129364 RepID=A0A6A4B0Z1_9STRA|nr:hypothetical protein PR003_g32770 [Phytophthora rubi]